MDASDYYKLRMEHTLQHLQQATRLIYFVSGAIIALFYFVMDKLKDVPTQRAFGIGLLVLLGFVNVIHAMFIRVQADWYKRFDVALAESTSAKKFPAEMFGLPQDDCGPLFTGLLRLRRSYSLLASGAKWRASSSNENGQHSRHPF